MPENNPHIFLNNIAISYDFQPRQGFGAENVPIRNRIHHSDKLLQDFANGESALLQIRQARNQNDLPVKNGNFASTCPSFSFLVRETAGEKIILGGIRQMDTIQRGLTLNLVDQTIHFLLLAALKPRDKQ